MVQPSQVAIISVVCTLAINHLVFNVINDKSGDCNSEAFLTQSSASIAPSVTADKTLSPESYNTLTTRQLSQSDLDAKYDAWVQNFKAARPEMQNYCMDILKTQEGSTSQFGQDLFLFYNLFKYWPALNKTGFYVDSGANDATVLSNTYFYDVCLGWKGLCIEPMAAYHAGILAKRSCQLVPKCVSDSDRVVSMSDGGAGSTVQAGGGLMVPCSSLKSMLEQNPDWDHARGISFWSLDVEGYEMTVLNAVDLSDITIDVLLIEDTCTVRQYARKLTENGFVKFHQLPIDSLFAHRGFPLPEKTWFNKHYDAHWKLNDEWRNGLGRPAC